MSILGRALILATLAVAMLATGLVVVGQHRLDAVRDVPVPAISAATAPAEIAQGGRLLRSLCVGCHAGPEGGPPDGAKVAGAPSFLGEIWAPNITADKNAGIGAWTDGQLARLVRNGVGAKGRYAAGMPRFPRLSDRDLAAIIGFLRSDDPLVAASPHQVPRTELGLAGKMVLAYLAGVDTSAPDSIPMPERGPTAEYGRYLASSVYACVDCHTDGFVPTEDKLRSKQLLAGGLALRTPLGEGIYSTNLTPDAETGLGVKTDEQMRALLVTGVNPAGQPVRSPMPLFRDLAPEDPAALLAYLRSVPAVRRRNTPGPARATVEPGAPPERLFVTLECASCHDKRAPFADALTKILGHAAPEVAAAIRHPEAKRPSTQMPSYAAVIDDATALRLATWLVARQP